MENNKELVKSIGKHSVYKFELIEKYVEEWAQKLLNNDYCYELVFIDCMSNCGEYIYDGSQIFGTPVRVSRVLSKVAEQYPNKKITLYFNDFDQNKIHYLSTLLPPKKRNFNIILSSGDGNDLIAKLGEELKKKRNIHYLLIYDPFDATINWNALYPFINQWGEVIINHMVSDTIRAIKMVKSQKAKEKYENTYLCNIEELITCGSNKDLYEQKILKIINDLRTNKRKYFVATFPFFNSKNALEYDLIHCTSNIEGFKLFKKMAWKVFKGHSSNKNLHGNDNQYIFDFENSRIKFFEDTNCFTISNVAEFIYDNYKEKNKVSLKEIWDLLNTHPIFPSDGFKNEIKKELKNEYDVKESKGYLIFKSERK